MASRDPITCHVLDTTTGRPAANITVTLICCSQPTSKFTATTNSDGRIANWKFGGASETLPEASIDKLITSYASKEETANCPKGSSTWKLSFNTGAYYGASKTFFPFVDLTFLVREGEHFHVPLLLGPYSFTTYRGS